MPLALNQIAQIAINAPDMPRAFAFCRHVPGMRHLFDAGPRLSLLNCGGIRLMLSFPGEPDHELCMAFFRNSEETFAGAVRKAA